MNLDLPGWFVVHAMWTSAIIAGVAGVVLAALGDHRARLRYAVAYAGLLCMILLPLAVTVTRVDFLSRTARIEATGVVEQSIGFSAFVAWRQRLVGNAPLLWMLGATAVMVRVVKARRRTVALRRDGRLDAAASLDPIVADLSVRLGIRHSVTVLTSPLANVPMVMGWRQPTIVLPVWTAETLTRNHLEAVLAHELAHVRRRDYAANLLQVAVDTILWFHPASRWLSQRARLEREYCCDDLAVQVAGDAREYARALAGLEDARHEWPLAIGAASDTLLDRIQRVVGTPRRVLTPMRAMSALLVALAVGLSIVTLAQIVPPAIPLNARLRTRTPPPAGTSLPATGPMSPRSAQR